jgi:hypothetical protein
MRRLQLPVFLILVAGVACQRGPGLCPAGMQPDPGRDVEGKSLWCKGKDPVTRRWIELWGPGARRQSCGFESGKVEGPFFAWHKGGEKWLEGGYRNGVKEGKWMQWDKDGHPVAEGEYRSGVLIAGAPVGMVALCEKQTP